MAALLWYVIVWRVEIVHFQIVIDNEWHRIK